MPFRCPEAPCSVPPAQRTHEPFLIAACTAWAASETPGGRTASPRSFLEGFCKAPGRLCARLPRLAVAVAVAVPGVAPGQEASGAVAGGEVGDGPPAGEASEEVPRRFREGSDRRRSKPTCTRRRAAGGLRAGSAAASATTRRPTCGRVPKNARDSARDCPRLRHGEGPLPHLRGRLSRRSEKSLREQRRAEGGPHRVVAVQDLGEMTRDGPRSPEMTRDLYPRSLVAEAATPQGVTGNQPVSGTRGTTRRLAHGALARSRQA